MFRLYSPILATSRFIVLILVSFSSVQGQGISELSVLESGKLIDRKLSNGSTHIYQLSLAAGESARLELKSGKARLQLSLKSEKDELIAAINDSDSPDLKQMVIVAEKATKYLIRIAPERSQTAIANYQLILTEKQTATSKDRESFALQILNWKVITLFHQREKSAFQQVAVIGQEAGTRWLALGELQQAGRMLRRRGQSLYVLGEYRTALPAFSQAVQLFHDAGDRTAEGRCLFDISAAYGTLAELSLAEEYHFRAVQLWREIKEPELPLISSYNVGRAYRVTGDWHKAREMFRQLLITARAHPHPEQSKYYEQQALSELGYTEVGARQPKQALLYLEQALPRLQADLEHPYDVPFVLNQMAQAWLQLGNTVKALDTCQQALQSARRLGQRRAEVVTLTTLGQVFDVLGRRSEAQAALTQAQSLNVALGIKRDQPATALRLAQLARKQGDLTEALRQVELAVSGIDELRAGFPPGNDIRATFLANWNDAQAFRLDLLMKLHEQQPNAGYATRAFDVTENGRARSLIELMLEVSADVRQNLDPKLLSRERELREKINTNRVASEEVQLIAEYNFIRGQIRQSSPRYAGLTQVLPLQLADVQSKLLDSRTLLLEYSLGSERSWLFAVTPDSLHAFELPARGVIEKQVRRYYELMTEFAQPPVFSSITEKNAWQQQLLRQQHTTAANLSQMLIAPAQALLSGKRLMIVPGTKLSYLPFAALPEPESHGEESKSRKVKLKTQNPNPLMVAHEIIMLPSASTLGVLRRASVGRVAAPKTLSVFADPVFSREDERMRQATPTIPATLALRDLTTSYLATGAALKNGDGTVQLSRLPSSRHEAEAIAALVPESQRKLSLDFDATRKTVLSDDLTQYRYVHFATHGMLNNENPELSALAFSMVDRNGAAQEGFLRAMDVYNLKLNAELVVLSGCQTALGKEIRGEGLVGLSRGFMYAGARRVMASLWKVNDNATAELMERVYRGMLGEKKLSPAAALRQAQIELWHDKKWKSPYYWAAFTLQGDW
jgi:CHAT domain-containing protein/tetratricopeptide (TPR) repeat protein